MNKNDVPNHVAIIMDGNGRWATKRDKDRSYGHIEGAKNVDKIVSSAFSLGIKTITLYAFSAENWARPKEEVEKLMNILDAYFKSFSQNHIKKDVRLVVIGDRDKLSASLKKSIQNAEESSKLNKEFTQIIALNYGGRQEIVNAVNSLNKKGEIITAESISNNLYTAPFGEPDLIIRTGGELRLSNFLLYQGAYSELYFTKELWPDFNERSLDKAVKEYGKRKRRFGKI